MTHCIQHFPAGERKSDNFPCSRCRSECLSELLGTYLLVFMGAASIVLSALFLGLQTLEANALIALSFGGTVAILILVLGKYSGTVINPALTASVEAAGLLERGLLTPLLLFQTLGGLLAGLSLRIVFGPVDPGTNLGSTKVVRGLNPFVGVMLEIMGTFILASFTLIATTKIKARRNQAIVVGTTLFVLILLIGPFTGAGFNPARSLGPALASGYLDNLYLYLVGPMVGALGAGSLFRRIRKW